MSMLNRVNGYLRHQTTTGIQFSELDSFRGWACLGIVFLHCLGRTGKPYYYESLPGIPEKVFIWPFMQGWAGLDLFFFISGFLLFIRYGKAYYEGRPSPSKAAFYKRRFFRIAPAYYANVLIMTAVWYLFVSKVLWYRFDAADLSAKMLFLHNLSADYSQSLNPVLWTLAIEAQFYLVLPFMAGWFYGRRWLPAASVVLLAGTLYKLGVVRLNEVAGVGHYINLALPPLNQLAWRIDQFVIGMCFANLWLYMLIRRPGSRLLADRLYAGMMVAGGAGLIIASFVLREQYIRNANEIWVVVSPLVSVGFGMLILGSLNTGAPLRKLFANPGIEFVGIISYSVYLWHYPVLTWIELSNPGLTEPGISNFIVRTCYVLPASIAVGLVSYLLFEKPFIKRSGQSRPSAEAVKLYPSSPR